MAISQWGQMRLMSLERSGMNLHRKKRAAGAGGGPRRAGESATRASIAFTYHRRYQRACTRLIQLQRAREKENFASCRFIRCLPLVRPKPKLRLCGACMTLADTQGLTSPG